MSIINSKDVYDILLRALAIVNPKVLNHGEVTGYILYKMLQKEGGYTKQELVDYTIIGALHDLGIFKAENREDVFYYESNDVWAHSIYGYLFLKYLSPFEDKAEIVLYHHLKYAKHSMIQSNYLKIAGYLTLADKIDLFMRGKDNEMDMSYFSQNVNIDFPQRALDLFLQTEKEYKVTEQLRTGAYKEELSDLLSASVLSENHKKRLLQMLVYMIDFRSEHTVVHTIATTNFAVGIGKLYRYDSQQLMKLYYGALLHDIGKLAIPLNILEADRRLADDEMQVMRAHVAMTESILRGVINEEILELAIRHHEKLDGKGYHRRLKGEELTTPQRIIAVADIISALYGKRSYKEGFDIELIKKILQEDADDNQICPEVVAVAVNNLEKLIKDFEKSKEVTMGTYLKIVNQYDEIYDKFKAFK